MSRGKHLLRRLGFGLAIGLAILFLVAGGLVLFLMTGPGERWISQLVTSRVNNAIAGSLRIGELEFRGDVLVLHDVEVQTPQGRVVIWAEHVLIDVALGELLGGERALDRLVVDNYRVTVRQRQGRWNIVQALEPVGRPPAERTHFAIHELELDNGILAVSRGETDVVIRELDITGRLARRDLWDARLEIQGRADERDSKKLAASIRARGKPGEQELWIAASYGESYVDARASIPDWTGKEAVRLSEVSAEIELYVDPFSRRGWTYGPVVFQGRLTRGELELSQLSVDLPGLHLERAAASPGAVTVRLEVSSLRKLRRSVADLTGLGLPRVSGEGTIVARLENPIFSATVDLEATFQRLAAPSGRVRQLQLEARAKDITELKQARIAVRAQQLIAGEHTIRNVSLELRRRYRQLELEGSVGRPYQASITARADLLDRTDWKLRLEQVRISYPRATWQSQGPALIDFDGAEVAIEGLVVSTDSQRIELSEAKWTSTARSADLRVAGLQLGQLPEPLLPRVPLAGELEGRLRLSTSTAHELRGSVHLALSNWRIERFHGRRAELDADLHSGRARGSFTARFYGGSASGTFEAPADLKPAGKASIRAKLDVEGIRLQPVWNDASAWIPPIVQRPVLDVGGRLFASAQLGGTVQQPQLQGSIRLRDGSVNLRGMKDCCELKVVARVTPERLVVDKLVARARGGLLVIEGLARPISDGRYRYRLDVRAEAFPVPGELRAFARATVRGLASRQRVEAKFRFQKILLTEPSRSPAHSGKGSPRASHRRLESLWWRAAPMWPQRSGR